MLRVSHKKQTSEVDRVSNLRERMARSGIPKIAKSERNRKTMCIFCNMKSTEEAISKEEVRSQRKGYLGYKKCTCPCPHLALPTQAMVFPVRCHEVLFMLSHLGSIGVQPTKICKQFVNPRTYKDRGGCHPHPVRFFLNFSKKIFHLHQLFSVAENI